MTDLRSEEPPRSLPPRVIPRSGPMRVPVHLFVEPGIEPQAAAVEQLRALASLPFLSDPVVAMPDVHPKSRNPAPTGIVLATEDDLVPLAIDKGLNCGMRTVRTGIPAAEFTPARVDALFSELLSRVPIRPRREALLSRDEVRRSLARGARFAAERFDGAAAEIAHVERGGNLLDGQGLDPGAAVAAVPPMAIEKGRRALGCLGAGNHFIELQEIVEVLDPARARALSLRAGDAVFMLHTGSEAVGSLTMSHYSTHGRPKDARGRVKLFLGKLAFHATRGGFGGVSLAAKRRYLFERDFFSIRASSPEGRRFAGAVAAASNFGFVNRAAIAHAIRESVRAALGRDASLRLSLLFDCSHVGIQRETHGGRSLFVHRHGANVALPASRCADHPVFRATGQPIPVPGSMGDDSFLCVGAEGNAATYSSANHGAGRLLDKADAIARYTESDVERDMARRRVRLYRGGTMNIAEQAPRSFKSIAAVLDAMRRLGVAEAVARVRPIAVLKG